VILSPSFTEGFDFADDMARWQVIAKMPYPYLGDKQVAAKKEADPEWYAMRTVMTVIQASGRICRNEKDHGVTYITDADFNHLWERYGYMFPNWWKEALQWL
jgi:ATP-dependent DNA helicase DinG